MLIAGSVACLLRPLVVVLGEADAIALPDSLEVFWTILGWCREVDDNEVFTTIALASLDHQLQVVRLLVSLATDAFAYAQSIFPLVEHRNLTVAAWVIRIRVAALEHFAEFCVLAVDHLLAFYQ